jgi:hypothetical protein
MVCCVLFPGQWLRSGIGASVDLVRRLLADKPAVLNQFEQGVAGRREAYLT